MYFSPEMGFAAQLSKLDGNEMALSAIKTKVSKASVMSLKRLRLSCLWALLLIKQSSSLCSLACRVLSLQGILFMLWPLPL